MRKTLLTLAAAAAFAVPAIALGGDCPLGSTQSGGLAGFECSHVCPLAREAAQHRSAGSESVTKAPSVRAALAAAVERNLRRI